MTTMLRRMIALAVLAAPLALLTGCGGEGTTVDDGVSAAPPITADSGKSLMEKINSERGPIDSAPGVAKKK